jgi:uncharacterized membrane protein (Fun14 family)
MRKLVGVLALLLGLVIFGIAVIREIGPTVVTVQQDPMQDIHQKVINDSVNQYNIAARQGTAVDACVHAGLVAEAYLQANQEAGYKTWKKVEHSNCKAAGVPGL